MKIAAVGRAFPPHYFSQEVLLREFRRVWGSRLFNQNRLEKLHRNVLVGGRHLALPIGEYERLTSWGQANDAWIRVATDVGEQADQRAQRIAVLRIAAQDLFVGRDGAPEESALAEVGGEVHQVGGAGETITKTLPRHNRGAHPDCRSRRWRGNPPVGIPLAGRHTPITWQPSTSDPMTFEPQRSPFAIAALSLALLLTVLPAAGLRAQSDACARPQPVCEARAAVFARRTAARVR